MGSRHRDVAMADDQQEAVFTIDFSQLEDLKQIEIDELKYDEVPEEVWIAVQHDFEKLPAVMSINNNDNGRDKGSFTLSICFCICDVILITLFSVVLFILSDGRCRQTSKQIIANANAQCGRALSQTKIHPDLSMSLQKI